MERIDPEQETRNDDPLVREPQEQKSNGKKDQAEDERVNPEVAPNRERDRQPRK